MKELGGIVTIHAGSKTNSVENITNSLSHSIAQKTTLHNRQTKSYGRNL